MIFLTIPLQGTLMMIVITVMVFTIMIQYVITMTPTIHLCIEAREETLDICVFVMLEETVGMVTIHVPLI